MIECDRNVYLDVVTACGSGHPVLVEQNYNMYPGNADLEGLEIHREGHEDGPGYTHDFHHDSISISPGEVIAPHSLERDSMTSQHGDDVTTDVDEILVYIEGEDTDAEEDMDGQVDEIKLLIEQENSDDFDSLHRGMSVTKAHSSLWPVITIRNEAHAGHSDGIEIQTEIERGGKYRHNHRDHIQKTSENMMNNVLMGYVTSTSAKSNDHTYDFSTNRLCEMMLSWSTAASASGLWEEHSYCSRIKREEGNHAYCVSTQGGECRCDSPGDESVMNQCNEDPDEKIGTDEVDDHNYCIPRRMVGAEETSGWDSTDLAGTHVTNMVTKGSKVKPSEIFRKDNEKVPVNEKRAESQSRVSGNMHETEGGDLQPHVGSMTPEAGIDMDSHISRDMSVDGDIQTAGDTTPRNVESGNGGTQADRNHVPYPTKYAAVDGAKYYRRQSERGLFECLICGRTYNRGADMRVHMRTHTGYRPHKCPDCSRSFYRLQPLQRHQKQHENKVHMCTKCDARFAFRFEKQKHMIEVHVYDKVPCPIGSGNGDIPAGKAHIPQPVEQVIMAQNRAKAGEFVNGEMAAKDNNISLEVDSGHCDIQNKDNHITQNTASGNGELTLDTDQIMAHSKQRGTQLTVNDIEAKYRRLSEKGLFECLICDQTRKWRGAMQRHMRSHTGYRPYKCPDCDCAFKYLNCLQLHKKVHENETHICTKCGARFAFQFEKLAHMREVHMLEVNVFRPITIKPLI